MDVKLPVCCTRCGEPVTEWDVLDCSCLRDKPKDVKLPAWLKEKAHERAQEYGITYDEALGDLADMYLDSPHSEPTWEYQSGIDGD